MATPILDALMEMRREVLRHAPGALGVTEVTLGREAGRRLRSELAGLLENADVLASDESMLVAHFAGMTFRWPA